ncbi:type II toxin-antitoxin system RelB/DinJ family antitoxin [Rothia nasimurium]|uniref:type II toxin-antitoxin system RelB/DinJ family antitoxin n=1 Tax=Rothia nasimurium TaxID=85336 RepID=UPI001EFF7BE4|nr:type II toxin-antitoxin system RelB/DinJ family antitoxin [Rothia nasimurium]
MADATISFRTDSATKEEVRKLYSDLGLDLSTALNMFLKQSLVDNGLPFTPHRENPASVQARKEAEERQGKTFDSVAALMADLTDVD